MHITQTAKVKNIFFWRRDCLQFKRMSLFQKNKDRNKVQNPYCSLGLLQQIMIISSANHHDLSAVYQAQACQIVGEQNSGTGNGGLRRTQCPPPYLPDEPEKAYFKSSCELQKSNGKL